MYLELVESEPSNLSFKQEIEREKECAHVTMIITKRMKKR